MAAEITIQLALAGQAGEAATKKQGAVPVWGTVDYDVYATDGPEFLVAAWTAALAAAGYPGTVASVGSVQCGVSPDLTYTGAWDEANEKFVAYTRADDLEVANATNLSAATTHVPFTAILTLS